MTIIVPGDELVLDGAAVDLSRGGMRITTTTDLPQGQPIVMRFALEPHERELLVRAKIALTFFDAGSKRYAHGVAFTQYSTQDYDAIASFISKKEESQ